MTSIGTSARLAAALSLTFVAGCGPHASEADLSANPSNPAAGVATSSAEVREQTTRSTAKSDKVVKLPPPPVVVELPAVTERSELLQRLPKSSLLVLRLPHVENLSEAIRRTDLEAVLAAPQASATRAELVSAARDLEREIRHVLPEFDSLLDSAVAQSGEAVVALTSVDVAAFVGHGRSDFPMTCALMFDAGERADEVDVLVQRILASVGGDASGRSAPTTGVDPERVDELHWRMHLRRHGVDADFAREGSQFLLHLGPEGASSSTAHPLALLEIEESFLASDLARGTKDLSRDGLVVVEAYLNIEPMWNALVLLAPADVKAGLVAAGLTSIRGASVVAALGEEGIHEELFLMSPGGRDLLTRTITNRPLDGRVTRYLSPTVSSATVSTFDFGALFTGIEALLPEVEKRALTNALLDLKRDGFDLRADLVDNVGPTFAITGDLDPTSWFRGDDAARAPDFTLVAEVADGTRLRAALEALLTRIGVRGSVQTKDIHGFMAYGTAPIELPGVDGQSSFRVHPHWYIGDDVFVFSLSRDGLARALAASWDERYHGPEALQMALARESGAFTIGIQAEAGRRASTLVGRRTSLGLELSTHEGAGVTSAYALASASAILSAVAVPNLTALRTDAGEKQVTETLHAIHAAQAAFKSARHIDEDSDGEGEYGTLGELTGALALRNERPALDPALLASTLRPGPDGLAHVGEYVVRIDLSNRLTRRIEFDEREFTAYAWPARADSLFRRAFAIDANGQVRVTDNDAAAQAYVGIERMPKPDAAKRVKSGSVKLGNRPPASLDGGFWRDL